MEDSLRGGETALKAVAKGNFEGSTPLSSAKFMSIKCYGSTKISKIFGRGSIPWMDANSM
jgi:hypothetical protein